jgi:hypothetical protein
MKDCFRAWARPLHINVSEAFMSSKHYQANVKRHFPTHGVFVGHRGYGFSPALEHARRMLKIVMLREPLSRVVSKFDYVKRERSMFIRQRVADFWDNVTLDEVVAQYNFTMSRNASDVLPAGQGSPGNKAFHHIIMHVLQYLAGWRFVYGPDPFPPYDAFLSKSALMEIGQRHLMNRDDMVVAIYPHYLDQLLPQLRAHLSWLPLNAGECFAQVKAKAAPEHAQKSSLSPASEGLLRGWLREEYHLYELAGRRSENFHL